MPVVAVVGSTIRSAVVTMIVGVPVTPVVVSVTVTVEVVVAFAPFPVESPDGVPELPGAPVVGGGR